MNKLTTSELLVYKHLLKGKLDKEIASVLSLSIHTIKKHNKSIYKKLNVRNRIEAALKNINY